MLREGCSGRASQTISASPQSLNGSSQEDYDRLCLSALFALLMLGAFVLSLKKEGLKCVCSRGNTLCWTFAPPHFKGPLSLPLAYSRPWPFLGAPENALTPPKTDPVWQPREELVVDHSSASEPISHWLNSKGAPVSRSLS